MGLDDLSSCRGSVPYMALVTDEPHLFSPHLGLDFCGSCSKTEEEGDHLDVPPEFSHHERAGEIMGFRPTNVIPLDMPVELGFWCPVCRVASPNAEGDYDERLQWSEYQGFLWCSVCNFDYPSALCVNLTAEKDFSRDYVYAGRNDAVSVFLDQIEDAKRQASSRPNDSRDGK